MNKTDTFLEWIDKAYCLEIPERINKRARVALIDYICVTLAGSVYNSSAIKKYLSVLDSDCGKSKVIGINRRTPLKDAVFLNGLNSHTLDYDDGTNEGIIHLGAPLFSVLLPLAEKYNTELDKLIKAIVIGYETSFSMARSMQPDLKIRGYHATGVCGILGATLAAAYMIDLSEKERKNAFSAACLSATGTLKALDDGSQLKPYNVARTSLLSIVSVQMALAGFCGPKDPLYGDRGYLSMIAGNDDLKLVKPIKDGVYALERTYIKPYAACRYCHPAIECAIRLRTVLEKEGIKPEEVTEIRVKTYDLAVRGHDHRVIPNVSSSKMSIPYSVCVALLKGSAGLNEFTSEMVENDMVAKLIDCVSVDADDECSIEFPKKQTATVSILANGRLFSDKVDYPKGEPENPLSEYEFKQRCRSLCENTLVTPDIFEDIYRTVYGSSFGIRALLNAI